MHANDLIQDTERALGVTLASFIAATSIWASPETYQLLTKHHPDGCWFPNMRRARISDSLPNGVRFDKNNYANYSIRQATGRNASSDGYSACHIHPESCYDIRYHTCIANLVLVPRTLESITDHFPHVMECLAYRAFELFKWRPAWGAALHKPEMYPTTWRSPAPLTTTIKQKIERRASAHKRDLLNDRELGI